VDEVGELAGYAMEHHIEAAAALGAHDLFATLDVARLTPGPSTERTRVARLVERIGPMADAAAARGLRLLWSPPFLDPAPAHVVEQVLRGVDRPSFGLLLDAARADAAARLSGHQMIDEGKVLPGALGLLERFRSWIGGVRVVDAQMWADWPPRRPDDQTDWPRLLPALLDAWVPASHWVLAAVPAEARAAREGFRLRLAPYTADAA
jgi:hypothetical protein